uniref:Pollen-specific leucine-rich repeat extensin-like protein 2 n=1 Tax=Mesocestoides corti TaxID=53468 RepID=A0A5K3FAH7_MESCO
MANVQVAKCMHYTGIPTTLIPDNNPCSNPDGVGSQRFNISYLPANTPKSPFVAYMPLQMANAIRAGQNTQASSIKIPAIPRPQRDPNPRFIDQTATQDSETKQNECVTKILVSNFDGPLTVTCMDVTPKAQNTGVQPLSSFPPYSNPIAFPQPFHGSGEYSAPSSRPSFYDAYEPRRHQRSHSKRRASKRRKTFRVMCLTIPERLQLHTVCGFHLGSKSPRKDKSREKVHSTNNSNKKKDSSPPAPPAVSAHPQPPILPPQPPQHPRANPPAPFVPTPEQLLSAPLRPVQPKQRPYSLIGVQTIPLNGEIEKKKPERKRNVSLDESRWPFEHVPMVPYLPLCPHMCSQQTRSMRSEKRLQRLLDMCEGKTPIRVQIVKDGERPHSLPKTRQAKDWGRRQPGCGTVEATSGAHITSCRRGPTEDSNSTQSAATAALPVSGSFWT